MNLTREDARLAETIRTRQQMAKRIAVAIGHTNAFNTDWGLSYAERERCYAAADAMLPFVVAEQMRVSAELAAEIEALPRHSGMEAPTRDGWVRTRDVLALVRGAGGVA